MYVFFVIKIIYCIRILAVISRPMYDWNPRLMTPVIHVTQAADSRGKRSRATTSEPNSYATSARSFSEDYKPTCYSGPNLPSQQLSVRTSEPSALDWEHGENQ